MKVEVKNIEGQKVEEIDLPESIYDLPLNEHVLHHVVKAYRANRRQGTHATKTRSLVSGTGKKPFKQKGTGNARQGSTRGPHMPGGAVVHGPQPRDYSQKINQATKTLAMKIALSDKLRHGKLVVVDDFAISGFSTKQIAKSLKALGSEKALLSDERKDSFLHFSARNLRYAAVKQPNEVNVEDLLRFESFVISKNGLNALNQRLGGQ